MKGKSSVDLEMGVIGTLCSGDTATINHGPELHLLFTSLSTATVKINNKDVHTLSLVTKEDDPNKGKYALDIWIHADPDDVLPHFIEVVEMKGWSMMVRSSETQEFASAPLNKGYMTASSDQPAAEKPAETPPAEQPADKLADLPAATDPQSQAA